MAGCAVAERCRQCKLELLILHEVLSSPEQQATQNVIQGQPRWDAMGRKDQWEIFQVGNILFAWSLGQQHRHSHWCGADTWAESSQENISIRVKKLLPGAWNVCIAMAAIGTCVRITFSKSHHVSQTPRESRPPNLPLHFCIKYVRLELCIPSDHAWTNTCMQSLPGLQEAMGTSQNSPHVPVTAWQTEIWQQSRWPNERKQKPLRRRQRNRGSRRLALFSRPSQREHICGVEVR